MTPTPQPTRYEEICRQDGRFTDEEIAKHIHVHALTGNSNSLGARAFSDLRHARAEIERQAKQLEELRKALQFYATPGNWKCSRCSKHDPLNCFCSQWSGPLLSGNKDPNEFSIDEAQPWGIADAALKEETNAR